jgi:hypothetical protein
VSDLADRLLEAIAWKELRARRASGGPWTLYDRGVGWEINELPDVHDGTTFTRTDAEFIADNDPVSVVRRCAADRETVIRCKEALLTDNPMLVHFAKQTLIERARGYGLEVEG